MKKQFDIYILVGIFATILLLMVVLGIVQFINSGKQEPFEYNYKNRVLNKNQPVTDSIKPIQLDNLVSIGTSSLYENDKALSVKSEVLSVHVDKSAGEESLVIVNADTFTDITPTNDLSNTPELSFSAKTVIDLETSNSTLPETSQNHYANNDIDSKTKPFVNYNVIAFVNFV